MTRAPRAEFGERKASSDTRRCRQRGNPRRRDSGLHGDEAVHCLLDVMYARKPYTVISRGVHIHPTVSELIPTVLQELSPL
jgi:hypothetical protein